jgi:hypothetical protein
MTCPTAPTTSNFTAHAFTRPCPLAAASFLNWRYFGTYQ